MSAPDAAPVSAPIAVLDAIARAEDLRRADALPLDAQADRHPAVRRAAARALARILDADDRPLLRALEDEDAETTAWAAYGLGESCKGREEAHVRALAARLGSLDVAMPSSAPSVDPALALLRAVGRCGGPRAEATLRAWLRSSSGPAEAAAYALGDLPVRTGPLSLETREALIEASRATPPVGAAMYALGRDDDAPSEDIASRLAGAARDALRRPGPERIFAVRALGRSGAADARQDLSNIVVSDDFTPSERIEAAHALAHLGKAGQGGLARGLAGVAGDAAALDRALSGDGFNVVLAVLDAAGDAAMAGAEPVLWAIARLAPNRGAAAAQIRRISALRCAAAEKLARGAWNSDVLAACDLGDGETGERALLRSLDREPLLHARRDAWIRLARSPHARIREAALGLAERHAELGGAALDAVAHALTADAPGVVAAAAHFVHSHPDRAFVLAAAERRAAIDPSAPPPTGTPARELDGRVAAALRSALEKRWTDDLVETRTALLDAAVAAGLSEAGPYAKAACADANATIRLHAERALAASGDAATRCTAPDGGGDTAHAPEVDHPIDHPARVVLDTDAGRLALRFDPTFAPVAVTRFVALARAGFYTGVAVHRVVPGFVAQLGDHGGDGYGGAGALLRCETSPVPFEPFDIGAALAGRDTASSQVFVVLARAPHLDGEYAWLGRAEGDWSAVAEGDVVLATHVEP